MSNIEKRIDTFLDEASNQLYEYLHHPNFRAAVLSETHTTESSPKLLIEYLVDESFEKETRAWEAEHIDDIFEETLLKYLSQKHKNIRRSLHSVKNNLKGFETPFDEDRKVNTTALLGVIQIPLFRSLFGRDNRFSALTILVCSLTREGVGETFISTLRALNIINNSETLCRNALQERINALTLSKLKCTLRKQYVEEIEKIISAFLEGDLEREIIKIKGNILSIRYEHDFYKSVRGTLSSLQTSVIQKIERLQQIGRIDVTTE